MKKSRRLVFVLALSTGLLGMNAGPPGALPARPGADAPSAVLGAVPTPVADARDIAGSGTKWKRWACWTCFGVGVAVTMSPFAIVGALILVGCGKACF